MGQKVRICRGTFINCPFRLEVGDFSIVNGTILSRGGVFIGKNVEILDGVYISTQSHDLKSPGHLSVYKSVTIDDYAWIGPRAVVLQGVDLPKGNVVCAAGCVSKSPMQEFSIVGGVPAKVVGRRRLFGHHFDEEMYLQQNEIGVYQMFELMQKEIDTNDQ